MSWNKEFFSVNCFCYICIQTLVLEINILCIYFNIIEIVICSVSNIFSLTPLWKHRILLVLLFGWKESTEFYLSYFLDEGKHGILLVLLFGWKESTEFYLSYCLDEEKHGILLVLLFGWRKARNSTCPIVWMKDELKCWSLWCYLFIFTILHVMSRTRKNFDFSFPEWYKARQYRLTLHISFTIRFHENIPLK